VTTDQTVVGGGSHLMADKKVPESSHDNQDQDLDDPVERMLKKTGCLEKHYSVQVKSHNNRICFLKYLLQCLKFYLQFELC